MALISLEDLDGLDEDQLDDDITHNPEPMDEEDSDRLLTHWQAVGRTHHVSVPPEMTGPIQEMTRNRQQREPLPYALISRHEKMGEVRYEERVYPAGYWACVSRSEGLYEQSISNGFMNLMRFICKENSSGVYLGMTVPVLSDVKIASDGVSFLKEVETCFFLPAALQSCPPHSPQSDVAIVHRQPIRIVASTFYGTTTEETIGRQIGLMWEQVGPDAALRTDRYIVAVYENPGIPQRRNELWFLRHHQS
ncbi:heme-binding protein soul4 [Gouania willdenowi]|nr:uncharacterized protein LOC114456196 [Gouania willdenowi]XP_028294821.1 uncharacterized protein LOC114456196 [Gouania willdenowi]